MKFNSILQLCLYTYLSVSYNFLNAQGSRFYMETDRLEIAEGETFELNIVLENMEGKGVKPPDVAPFKIVRGPSTSSSISIINGKSSSTQSYQYLLLATKVGKFSIQPARMQFAGKTLNTNALTIEVIASRRQNSDLTSSNEETFVRLEAKVHTAYVGQQVTLNLVLYTRKNIESFQMINEPQMDGFFAQPINDINDQPQTINLKGKEYFTQIVRRWALFPQKTGEYTLGPINCNLDIVIENSPSSFFFRDTRRETVTSNILKFRVQDLPNPKPTSFTGAVGDYTMSAQLKNPNVSTGEGVAISIQIEGDGDPKIVQAPSFNLPDGFDQYSPSLIRDETILRGDKLMMKKEFDYVLVPSKDSIYTVTPSFSYFDINTLSYKTIQSDPLTIHVVKGDNNVSVPNHDTDTNSVQVLELSNDDRFFRLENRFFGSKYYYMVLFAILSVFISYYYFIQYKKKTQLLQLDDSHSSVETTNNKLKTATHHMLNLEKDKFFIEISNALTSYLKRKLQLPESAVDRNEMIKYLTDYGVSMQVVEHYSQISKICDMAKFAGVYENMEETIQKTENLIQEIEKHAALTTFEHQ